MPSFGAARRILSRQALIWGLQQQFGPAFTPELREAWSTLYDTIQSKMAGAGSDWKNVQIKAGRNRPETAPGADTGDAAIDMKPQPQSSTQEVLAGLIERVTYHNRENGFCVLRAKARGHRDVVTVVGHAAAIAAGEWITASGEWVNDRTHGQQFRARFLRTSPPTAADGIEKYLSSICEETRARFRRKGVRCHRVDAGASARGGWHRAGSCSQHSCRVGRAEGGAGNHGVPLHRMVSAPT
jgi:hypothetical protein